MNRHPRQPSPDLRLSGLTHFLRHIREDLDHRAKLEQHGQRKLDLELLLDPCANLHDHQRVATQLEEVVAHSDVIDIEDCAHMAAMSFPIRFRAIGRRPGSRLRSRGEQTQVLAVDLAHRRGRQLFEKQEFRRDHEVRQARVQVRAASHDR